MFGYRFSSMKLVLDRINFYYLCFFGCIEQSIFENKIWSSRQNVEIVSFHSQSTQNVDILVDQSNI